ncbi:hypothetical protein [Streptomyces sp. NBC_01615]|uniref:hypothetical protein n=1 Tax=Streptomyces sp. NBC_01615 TaxID=2975898 RepID=UPI0038663193
MTTQSSGIKIRTGTSTWANATTSKTTVYPSSSPNAADYYCGTLTFTTVTADSHWKVAGQQP